MRSCSMEDGGGMKVASIIQFTAYGNVQPAHRPRAVMIGGKARMHNDKRHTSWMESIRNQALGCRPHELLDGPLVLSVDIYVLRPKSAPRKRFYPVGRPDLSNYVKAVEDALMTLE